MPPPKSPLLGRLAVHNKLITLDQLEEVLREQAQRNGGKNLGELLVEKGYVTPKQLAALVRAQGELVARDRARRAAELGAAAGAEAAPPAPAEAPAPARAPAVAAVAPAAPAAPGVATGASTEADLNALLRD